MNTRTVALVNSAVEPLVRDLQRVDALIAEPLAALGVQWSSATRADVPRAPDDFALAGLRRAIARFGLSAFDCDAMLLALAPEIDDRYAAAFSALHRNAALARPSIGLVGHLLAHAFGITTGAALAALGPSSRLVEYDLVRVLGDGPYATRSLSLPATVWQQLNDDRAACGIRPMQPSVHLDRLILADTTATCARHALREIGRQPLEQVLVAIHGASGRTAMANALAAALQLYVLGVPAAPDPTRFSEVGRDARWWNAAILTPLGWGVADLVELGKVARVPILSIVEPPAVRELVAQSSRVVIEVRIDELDTKRRQDLWRRHAGELPDDGVAVLAGRYRFGPARVIATTTLARARAAAHDRMLEISDVLHACRADDANNGLARRLETTYSVDDLVVPAQTRRELDLLESAARHGHHVFSSEGSGARIHGMGAIVALFAGPPGTGKTMSAQVVAGRLGVDLLRVDLSQVVNKYIGETEKHLDRVFRDAEAGGAILFFDEADALFGKRTDVRDAHDRYANLETAYLLQRLEHHRGVTILATNLKRNLDAAFMRRIQMIVDFELPGLEERKRIWERHLVPSSLAADVDLDYLAQFALAGGDIRNAVTSAVLLAAQLASPVEMSQLVVGVWRETQKSGRLVQADDFGRYRDHVIAYARVGRPVLHA